MKKQVTTRFTITESYKRKIGKHTYDEEVKSVITLENGKFSQVSLSSGSVWASLLACNLTAFKRFIKVFFKTLKKLDELEIIDINDYLPR